MSRDPSSAWMLLVPAALLCWLTATASYAADDCKPLTRVTSFDLVSGPGGDSRLVPAEINGKPTLMLLDTGGAITEITSATADALGLRRHHGNMELVDVSGLSTDEYAVASLALSRLRADNVAFMITNDTISGDTRVGGLLAPDILQHYDVSIDFGTNKLDLLSQDHCEGKVVYWKADAIAVVPMRVLNTGHIFITVKLDGRPVTAIVDSGASNSTLRLPTAVGRLGVTPGAPDTPQEEDLPGRPGAHTYSHRFKTLDFEGISVSNPLVLLIPDFMSSKMEFAPETGRRIKDKSIDESSQDMLIGMDVLKHLHLYVAYKEEKLYITPAQSPEPHG